MNDKKKTSRNGVFRRSKVVKIIITLFGVCCIGLIVLVALVAMSPDSMIPGNFSESKLYENEYLSFKIPKSLIDITFMEPYDEEMYISFSRYEDIEPERNCVIVYHTEINESSVSTFLDTYYEDLKNSERNWVKNFTQRKINFNGIPAIKVNEEYYGNDSGKYGIFLLFVHDKKFHTLYFSSDDINSINYMYELAESSLILK